jgi:hypothetical protein
MLARKPMTARMKSGETKQEYCRRRAAEERAAAAHAADERAAQSHRDLAEYFEALASDAGDAWMRDDPVPSTSTLPADFRIIP